MWEPCALTEHANPCSSFITDCYYFFLPIHSLMHTHSDLQCDRENSEHLKYLRNVYCVITNHSKDQDMRTSQKTTN